MSDVVRVYRDYGGKWRWRRRAASGELMDVSTQGWDSYAEAKQHAEEKNPGASIVVTRESEKY